MTFIRPVFELYHANYKKLSFLGNNITIHGNILAQSLVQTNQPDSALKVYTELVKLTQLDSLFEKIEGTYISIHGSKEGYQDYLVQNGIDKFIVETKHAPEALFKLYGSDKEVSLSSLKGKVVVLNFWGTYCVPCIKEMPELNDLKKRFSYSSDVVFLAPTRDNAAKLAGFFKEKQFD
ncbi:MAG: TlpA family protein disulfide reductase [Cytophagales bacterium]|nr:MAG: TlpA family protein disulfide reductase [Cytophagales bacterium]